MRPAYRRRAARRRRWLRRGAVLAAAVAAVVAALLISRPGSLEVRPIHEMPSDAVFFYQEDPAWAGDAMGNTGGTLGRDGDAVACLASLMAMEKLPAPFDGEVNPGTLNAWLGENGGYDGGGLNWKRVASLLGVKTSEVPLNGSASAALDALLQREIYPVARVTRPDVNRDHWVLIAGSVHGEYTIVDPLDPTGTLNSLGLYGNRIRAARYFEDA